MQFISRSAFLALVAVLVMSAVASASAAGCHKEAGAKHDFVCINGERLGSETEAQSEKISLHVKPGTVYSLKWKEVHITCEAASSNSEGLSSQLGSGGGHAVSYRYEIKWEKCKLVGIYGEKCQVPKASRWVPLHGREQNLESLESLTLQPVEGTTIGQIGPFEELNKCPATLKGEKKAGGELPCTLPAVSVEAIGKELACSGNLTIGGGEDPVPVSFTLVMELSGPNKGKTFSIYQGT